MMRRRGLLAGGAAAAAVGACSAPATHYRLQVAPGPVLGGGGLSVAVRSVSIPQYLDQDGIAMPPRGDFEYAAYPNDIWAEPLADMLQAVMVQELGQRLPQGVVLASGGAIGAESDSVVEIDVLRFDPASDGMVVLVAKISVKGKGGVRRTVGFTRTQAARGVGALGVVAAMSGLWGQAADEVAALLAMGGATSG